MNKNKKAPQPTNTAQKFLEAQAKHNKAAKKHNIDYESSSDEESPSAEVLELVWKGYDGQKELLGKTQQFLENVFQSGSATCLICIASVKRADPIWSCTFCYSFFHLPCIQRWANDSIAQLRMRHDAAVGYYNNTGQFVPKPKNLIQWNCPKCRNDYPYEEVPRLYSCFCKKEINPANHAWLVPHSCGEQCQKELEPKCGHKCVLLCHPGPCPPCPQIISKSCSCGQSKLRTIRCSQKNWKCLNKCKRKLNCGIHTCGGACHEECPPCQKKSQTKCVCGNSTKERSCSDLTWQCDKICKQIYPCGLHKCQRKCHLLGDCGECPLGLLRECPCGKVKIQAPCSEEIGPCGSTCQKMLDCGMHICMERCHKDKCGQCLIITPKKCRCGCYTKDLPCSKTFNCETKCKNKRDCNKHPCNRKCCDNQCPPCDKICGKTLSCGKHKCASLCHMGECYPCDMKAEVKCRCGSTIVRLVPCGREKKTRPPKCLKPCKIPSKCHHQNPHRCHPNECPPCHELCQLPNSTTKCEHPCAEKCHDAVKIVIVDKNFKPAGPWERQVEKFEIKKLPHPPCKIPVPVTCIGGHETIDFPCCESSALSCGRQCGRTLKCGNHVCQEECHSVKDKTSVEQDKLCPDCQQSCIFTRPCIHRCEKPCHSDACDVCTINIKLTCHCGITPLYFKCGEYYANENQERENLLSCGNQCTKNYPCGHRCKNICHAGDCLNPDSCKKKVKIWCKCKLKKADILCEQIRGGFQLSCDEACAAKKAEAQLAADVLKRKEQELLEEKQRQELLDFEKKFGKKKYKERKQHTVERKDNYQRKVLFGVGAMILIIAIAIYISDFF